MSVEAHPDVLERLFILPADAMLVEVAELSPRVRAGLGSIAGSDDQVALSRPGYRVPSRLITPPLAALVREFRQPSRVVDAVLRFSRANGRDPFETLEDAFDALAALISSQLLVPADSRAAEPVRATLAPGQQIAGYEVLRLVSALEDVEVYLGQTGEGRPVALKIARPAAPRAVTESLAREARLLRHLGGERSPALIELAPDRDRSFLAMEWRPGVPVWVAAHRARVTLDGGRRTLHALGAGVLSAYAWLHERGVLHGDIHPGNIIVGEQGEVTLLDFGRSRLATATASGSNGGDPERAGVPHFYEPEVARALRAGSALPTPTYRGEQYSLGALVYQLFTGVDYVDFSPEHELLLAQVLERPPLSFIARGVRPWPAVEAVLATALAKEPGERYPSVAQFRDSFVRAGADRPRGSDSRRPVPAGAAYRLLADWVRRADVTSGPPDGAPRGPEGARDLAWFALRASLVRDDPALLASADVWARRARASEPAGWALAAVAAEIDRARGDRAAQESSLSAFVAACERAGAQLDLLGGRSGALAGAAGLLDGLTDGEVDTRPLQLFARRAIEEIWTAIDPFGPVAECPELPHLGMAHGWAGVLYATARACRSTATPHPSGLKERVQQLSELAQEHGRGVRWPGTMPHARGAARTPSLAPGWCSGSAGHASLWALLHRELGDPRFLDLAERCGRYAVDHPETANPDLCCGTTGRGFAMLRLYQATGEAAWLTHARAHATAAAARWKEGADPFSLRKGSLGTALLLVELEAPERALLPSERSLLGASG